MIMTVTHFLAKIHFSPVRFLKRKKKAGTNLSLLSWSTIMKGLFMKTYLHKPIKFVQLFSGGKIQKCFI